MSANINIYQIITDRICEQLERGIIPWNRPWTGVADSAISYTTGKPYSLLNQMLLGEDGEYITFAEVTKLGGKVKKGAKSQMVVFFKRYVKEESCINPDTGEEENKEKITFALRYYNVFNIKDCDGIPAKNRGEKRLFTDNMTGEEVISDYINREASNGFALVNIKGNRAFYDPSLDKVVLPLKEQFTKEGEYYSTAFHEIAHSTLKECRCNRKQKDTVHFGDEDYSKEELVAEITSANICSVTGIETASTFQNSVAYIQSWLRALENDNRMIVFAASQAEKATRYILGITE